MKYTYLILSLIIEAIGIWLAREHPEIITPPFIILLFLILGISLKVLSRHQHKELKNLSWGLFIGSLIHLAIGIGIVLYVLFLFRNIAD